MTKLWREPLVHFALLGALLFAGHGLWERVQKKSDYTITVSAEEIERQAVIFAGENRRQPTDEDIQALLYSHVEEQVLMREARRLGLEDDDTIIRRRLAQKMRFMIEDGAPPKLPEDATLKSWFETNKAMFIQPEKRGFSHVYLSPETRPETMDSDGEAILKDVTDENWETLGDPFMMRRDYPPLTQQDFARQFGGAFAQSLFSLGDKGPKGETWQGPLSSAFGMHIVRITNITPRVVPAFEDVRADVEARWSDDAQRAQNSEKLKALLGKYKVNVDGLDP